MEGGRRKSKQAPARGWLSSLFGATLLISGGFVVGILVGVSWENSDLLVSHARGLTEVVPLAEVAETTEPVAEDPAAPLGASPPDVASPPPSVAKAPAPVGGFDVQVGSFVEPSPADTLMKDLRKKGFPVHVVTGESGGARRWRVRVGPVGTRDDADQLASRLKRDERLPTWVVVADAE